VVVCGDARPDVAGGELVADAQSQECVAQRGVCGHHGGGAHGQLRCRSGVSGDRLVEVEGGGADEGGDVLGFEVQVWRWLGAGEFALHLVA
jgi:hypothetical protein